MAPRRLAIAVLAAAVLGATQLLLFRPSAWKYGLIGQIDAGIVVGAPAGGALSSVPSDYLHARHHNHTTDTLKGLMEILNSTSDLKGDDDPFAQQNPKGILWRSPGKAQNRTDTWWRYSDSCYAIDQVCRSARNNKWFYYASNKKTEAPNQPNFELKYVPYSYRRGVYADVRAQMRLQTALRVESENLDGRCSLSDVPLHIVLHSQFNDMIGEFYTRSLLNVHSIQNVERYNPSANDANTEAQYYIHIPYENKAKLLDAHRLFVSGLSRQRNASRTVRWAKESFHLLRPDGDDIGCKCYEKLVFCGYSVFQQQSHLSQIGSNGHLYNYTLWPGKYIDSFGADIATTTSFPGVPGHSHNWDAYDRLRSSLLDNIGSQYPDIDNTIKQYRRRILLSQNLIESDFTGDISQWTFVGLAQRTSRRRWLNMQAVMEACRATHNNTGDEVVFVEVNVEHTSSPSEQFLLHRSLDVMVGVHGAQLTQGILLPPSSYILELLPWVPNYARGDWVSWTSRPTPLGVIFHNTDLNHFGYKLGRCSVPICENATRDEERECFEREGKCWS